MFAPLLQPSDIDEVILNPTFALEEELLLKQKIRLRELYSTRHFAEIRQLKLENKTTKEGLRSVLWVRPLTAGETVDRRKVEAF